MCRYRRPIFCPVASSAAVREHQLQKDTLLKKLARPTSPMRQDKDFNAFSEHSFEEQKWELVASQLVKGQSDLPVQSRLRRKKKPRNSPELPVPIVYHKVGRLRGILNSTYS